MGIVKKIGAGLLAILAAAALWFRSQRDNARAKRAQDHADRQTAAVEAKDDAQDALDETRARHEAERTEPDTDARDDLEGKW